MSSFKKPKRLHTFLEAGALVEAMVHFGARPFLRMLPRGDGHPVLVIPGFLANDSFTAQLRKSLQMIGYEPYGWELGVNKGLSQKSLEATQTLLKELVLHHQQPVSIIGWSLGGLYARALANKNPECVRQVITMGTPFGLPADKFTEVREGIARLYESFNSGEDPMLAEPSLWYLSPPIPTTSVYTETDGIAHWHYCLGVQGKTSQNIRVVGTHAGLMHNPMALYLVADRLRFKAKDWSHFELSGWHKMAFESRCLSSVDTRAAMAASGLSIASLPA